MAAKPPGAIYMLITCAAVQGSRMRKESYPLITVIAERIASKHQEMSILFATKLACFHFRLN